MSELSKKIGKALKVRDLIKEQKSDHDRIDQWQASNTDIYPGEAVENKGHSHKLTVDEYGCGRTSIDEGHFHMIEFFEIVPCEMDGHTHPFKLQEKLEAATSLGHTFRYNGKGEKLTDKPPIPHYHKVEVDEYGNGTTNKVEGHSHKVVGFKIYAAPDGHSHYRLEQQRRHTGEDPWDLGV
jgi:hypothetical protein